MTMTLDQLGYFPGDSMAFTIAPPGEHPEAAELGGVPVNLGVNVITNPTMVGVVAGTPGTLPDDWLDGADVAGLTRQIYARGQIGGIDYFDLRLSGTPSGAGFYYVGFSPSFWAVAAGQAWEMSVYVQVLSGTLAGVSALNMEFDEYDAMGVYQRANLAEFVATSAPLPGQRNRLMASLADADTTQIDAYVWLELDGGAVDITLRIGLPHLARLDALAAGGAIMVPALGRFLSGGDLAAVALGSAHDLVLGFPTQPDVSASINLRDPRLNPTVERTYTVTAELRLTVISEDVRVIDA